MTTETPEATTRADILAITLECASAHASGLAISLDLLRDLLVDATQPDTPDGVRAPTAEH
jgi:hypothetical protein